ncbi:uncharacterized protein wipf3 isoform X2 [Gasterosteus aculeatus]
MSSKKALGMMHVRALFLCSPLDVFITFTSVQGRPLAAERPKAGGPLLFTQNSPLFLSQVLPQGIVERTGQGGVREGGCPISPERMERSLFPVLRSPLVEALPVREQEVTQRNKRRCRTGCRLVPGHTVHIVSCRYLKPEHASPTSTSTSTSPSASPGPSSSSAAQRRPATVSVRASQAQVWRRRRRRRRKECPVGRHPERSQAEESHTAVKANTGDVPSSGAASQGSSGGPAPMGPSLGGLFAAGFPTLRPTGQRDLAGKTTVSRSSSSASVRPLWNPPTPADTSSPSEPLRAAELRGSVHRPLPPSSSAPASPSHGGRDPPPFPAYSPPPPPPAPPSAPPPPPPPQAFQERAAGRPPPLPSCPPPPPPYQVTKPTWLPIQHSYHTIISQPSTPPPPPPPPFQPPKAEAGDRKSGCFYPLPPSPVHSEPSRFSILRDSPLGPPPPPPAPPLPASFGPSCPSTLPPPPPKLAAVPSPAMRSLPPSYPCNAPTRRPPAVPRSAGVGRLPPPPAPPARSPSTELSCRTPPPPPPPPLLPLSLRNGHLHSLDNFESKFQFHPVEDFPPPDEFKPFPRIYPSKENRGSSTTARSPHPFFTIY